MHPNYKKGKTEETSDILLNIIVVVFFMKKRTSSKNKEEKWFKIHFIVTLIKTEK